VTKFVDMFEGESREIFVRRGKIAGALRLQPGERVADVGAGTGLFTWMFAQKVGDQGKVYAVDISPEFVRHLGENAQEKGLDQVEVVLCSDRSAELATNSIDKAFICDTYHHFEFPAATMRSIHRALRPGGELVLVDFERIPGVSRPWILDHVRAGKEQVLEELRSFGFELVEELEIEGLEENYCLRLRRT
jgi:FkbM family methyltransferase